jgi:dihydropyrimidinase
MDYSFHQIITDPTDHVVENELPAIVASGIRSFKAFLTYDPLRLDDAQFLRVLAAAGKLGALVTVHCENYDAIAWRSELLLKAGLSAPRYHAWSRPVVVEREATYRAIALAELVDQPIQIFHVSAPEVAHEIARAQRRGVKIWAETCPQYLTLGAADMDRPGDEGAKYMCSPSPRDQAAREGLWDDIRAGTLGVISSDHCGYSFNGDKGKLVGGPGAPFTRVPNGIPGLATRMPLLFTEGVAAGRIDLNEFVRLTSTHPARLFGLYPAKGTIAPGSDADIVLWDPTAEGVIRNAALGHAIDYTPYEGRRTIGKPVMTFSRGELVMEHGNSLAVAGRGRFLARGPYDLIRPTGRQPNDFPG